VQRVADADYSTPLMPGDLTADEIAGALTGQIERLVVERYHREHPKTGSPARVFQAGRRPHCSH
jgi:hypothetical protein